MVPTSHQPLGRSLEKAAPWGLSSGVPVTCPEPLEDRQGWGQTPPQPLPRRVSTCQPRGRDAGSPWHTFCLKTRPPRGRPCSGFCATGVLSQGEVVPRTPRAHTGRAMSGQAVCSHGAGSAHVARSRSFLEMMEARSRGHASPLTTSGQSPSSGSQSPVVPPSTVSTGSSSPSTPQPALQPPFQAPPAPPAPTEAPPPPAAPPRRSIIARLFGASPATEVAPPPPGRPHPLGQPPPGRPHLHLQGRPQPQGGPHPRGGPEAGPGFLRGSSPVCLPGPRRDKVPHPPGQVALQPSHTIPLTAQREGVAEHKLAPAVPRAGPSCRGLRESPGRGGLCS